MENNKGLYIGGGIVLVLVVVYLLNTGVFG